MSKRKLKINSHEKHIELFTIVIDELSKINHNLYKQIANESGVSVSTLYNWVNWKITSPHFRTVVDVATAIGFDVDFKRPTKRLMVVK